eukprot:TRINITY_DN60434_c0_g1_i1.p1 TRINITY_DN60434_c0_g1~~TRINITY_DN60434_c0_g1_i1.p1  ORF type:complete len:190 (+),score=54.71 TRINITY_DN60434_c0_g1_i1:101-670(+)
MGASLCGSVMPTISIGDRVPDATLKHPSDFDSHGEPISLQRLCADGKIVILGVPAAFGEPETSEQIPEYIQKQGDFRVRTVREVVVIAVDSGPSVLNWAKRVNPAGAGLVRFYADPSGAVTAALGLTITDSAAVAKLGPRRSKRYAMIVDTGVVTSLDIADSDALGLSYGNTSASNVLTKLGQTSEDAE